MRNKKGGGAPKGACRPLSAPHNQMSPSESARARKRIQRDALAFRRRRRGTVSHSGRSRSQLQNHVSWDGAEAGVLPASRLSSPAGSPPTGPFAGRVVPQSRPGAIGNSPAGTAPAPPFRHAFRKGVPRLSEIRYHLTDTGTLVKHCVTALATAVTQNLAAPRGKRHTSRRFASHRKPRLISRLRIACPAVHFAHG